MKANLIATLRAAAIATALLFLARPALAQVTTGNITGTVVDPQGGGIPGATVMATHVPTGTTYKAVTRLDGRFQLLEVVVGGPYTVRVTMASFKDSEQKGIIVALGEDHKLEFKLELKGVTDVVSVTATTPPIDFSQAGAAGNISNLQLQAIPTIARSIFDIVQANPYFTGYNAKGNGQLSISVAGRNNRYNNIQIDGAANNDIFGISDSGTPEGQAGAQPISLDAIQELQLVISPYDVRQGGFSGGGLNLVTRSGANALSGDGFFYGRSQKWVGNYFNPNALNVAKQTAGVETSPFSAFSDKQGGGSIGGAIKQNKVFFFGSSDSQRQRTPTGISSANFASSFSTATYPNSKAAIDSVLAVLQNTYHYNPVGASGLDPDATFTRQTDSDKVFARVDINLRQGERLTIRNNYVHSLADSAFPTISAFLLPDNFARFRINTNSTVFQLNSTFGNASSPWINEARVASTAIRNNRAGQLFEQNPFPKVTVTIASGTTVVAGRDNSSTANQLFQDNIEINDDLTTVRGSHTITLGTHDELFHFQNLFIQNTFGNYTFTATNAVAATGEPAFDAIQNLQRGIAQAYSYNFSNTGNPLQKADFRVAQWGFYAGDQWRASKNLTVTGGLRVDLPRFNHTPGANPLTVTSFGMRTDVVPSPTQWSPRVGFNWDMSGTGKRQIRGGVGVFTGRTPYVWISNQFTNNGLDFSAISITNNANNRIPFVADASAQPTAPTGGTVGVTKQTINLVDPKFKFPSQLRANIAFDTTLPWGLTGKAEVIFGKTIKDILYQNLNIVQTGTSNLDGRPLFNPPTGTAIGIVPTVGPVLLLTNSDKGHSVTFTYDVQRNFRNSFAFEVGYLYGQVKSQEESSSSVALTSWSNVFSTNPNNPPLTTSDFDPGHRITAHVSYEVPITHGLKAMVSLFYTGQSGHPYTVSYSFDANGDTQSFNDNLYLLPPSQSTAVTYSTTNGTTATYDTLNAFFQSLGKCVTDQIGSIYVRNSCREPWVNTLNMRVAVRLPFKKVKADITMDILNLMNLLSDTHGLVKFVSFNQVSVINPFSTNGQITRLDLTTISPKVAGTFSPFGIDDVRSRWQMQLGARIVF